MPAYNSIFPATYPVYQPGYYQAYQPQMQQPQPAQPSQPAQQPSSILWVGGIGEAQMYPVAPNAAVALWDSSAPAIYLKQADASGKPSMKVFDLVERTEPPQAASVPGRKEYEYAAKSDLEKLNSALDDVRKDVERIRSEMEAKA